VTTRVIYIIVCKEYIKYFTLVLLNTDNSSNQILNIQVTIIVIVTIVLLNTLHWYYSVYCYYVMYHSYNKLKVIFIIKYFTILVLSVYCYYVIYYYCNKLKAYVYYN